MHIPQPILSEIETALSDHLGRDPGPLTSTPVGGGCISPAARVRSAAGDVVFLKWSGQGTVPGLFEAEARALEALRGADAVRVPAVIALGGKTTEHSWILLEWLEPGRPTPALWERLGQGLDALHGTMDTPTRQPAVQRQRLARRAPARGQALEVLRLAQGQCQRLASSCYCMRPEDLTPRAIVRAPCPMPPSPSSICNGTAPTHNRSYIVYPRANTAVFPSRPLGRAPLATVPHRRTESSDSHRTPDFR